MRFAVAPSASQLRRNSFVGQVVAVVIGLQLLVFGAFLACPLPIATGRNLAAAAHNLLIGAVSYMPLRWQDSVADKMPVVREPFKDVRYSLYVPAAPLTVFLGYVLGWQLALVATVLYVSAGLAGPLIGVYLFAGGGGSTYYTQPGFGYLVGLLVAAFLSGWITVKRRTSFRQLLAVLSSVLALHICGLAYLFGICAVNGLVGVSSTPLEWQQWLFEEARNLSWYPLPYDFAFSLLVVGVGFPFRWLVTTLTAPDIGLKPKTQPNLEELLETE